MLTHIEPQKQGLFIANVTADSDVCVFQSFLAQTHDTKKNLQSCGTEKFENSSLKIHFYAWA